MKNGNTMKTAAPQGTLALQTVAMPADTNANGDIFGGWLVSQMDLGGGIIAKQRARQRVVTVAIESIIFHKPVRVGDIVSCYAEILKIGRTSMQICVTVWSMQPHAIAFERVTEGLFTYVAIDEQGAPTPIDKKN